MVDIFYKASLIRQIRKLDPALRETVYEKVDEFRDPVNHKKLKVHKLSGKMKSVYSFSVDYQNRIIFEYTKNRKEAVLLDIGDHDLYK